jgi:hypothetical protein
MACALAFIHERDVMQPHRQVSNDKQIVVLVGLP